MGIGILAALAWGLLLLLGALTVQSWYSLFCNYLVARKMDLRFHVIPISHLNHFWMLVDHKVLKYVRRIFGESAFTRYNWMGWELHDRWYSHHELGDVFMLVTPGRNWLYIGHPDIVMDIVRRRDDFPRCIELTQVLDVFGPSVGSVRLPFPTLMPFSLVLAFSLQTVTRLRASNGCNRGSSWRPASMNDTTRWSGPKAYPKQPP